MQSTWQSRVVLGALVALAFGAGLFHQTAQASAACEHTLKIASLAPPGSDWFKAIQSTGREIKKATDGAVCFKVYGGGVMGDEAAMVRKMRTGQIDAAAVTSIGLGDIEKQVLVLQLPLTFRSNKQLDCVRDKMSDRFKGLLDKKGFVLLGWGDVGFGYLFSNTPVASPDDVKGTKLWVWDADPISKEVAKVAGVNATFLGVPDVLPSLSTGVVDAFLNSPYGAIALQWHSKATHVTDLKLAVTIGGSVISKKSFEKLSPEHQAIVQKIAGEKHKALLTKIRKSNKSAQKQLAKKYGYTVVKPTGVKEKWLPMAKKVRKNLTGSMFPADLVNEMDKSLKSCK